MRAHRRVVIALAVVAAASGLTCYGPTELVLDLSTDRGCFPLPSTAIYVGGPDEVNATDRAPTATTGNCENGSQHIGSLVVVPSGARDDRIGIRVVMGIGKDPAACDPKTYANCIVARRKIRFAKHQSLGLPIVLERRCIGVPCTDETTCVAGKCKPADVEAPGYCDTQSCPDAGAPPDAGEGGPAPDASRDGAVDDAGAPCSGGELRLVDTPPPLGNLAVDSTYVFWVDTGKVLHRQAKAGGGVEAIPTGADAPSGQVAADADLLCWSTVAGSACRRGTDLQVGYPVQSVSAIVLAPVGLLALGNDAVGMATMTVLNRNFSRMGFFGPASGSMPGGMTFESGTAWFTDGPQLFGLVPPPATLPPQVVTLPAAATFVAVDDTFFFTSTPAGVRRLVRSDTTLQSLFDVTAPLDIGIDGPNVYVTGSLGQAGVYRLPRKSQPGTLFSRITQTTSLKARGLAIDSDCVYWWAQEPSGAGIFTAPK